MTDNQNYLGGIFSHFSLIIDGRILGTYDKASKLLISHILSANHAKSCGPLVEIFCPHEGTGAELIIRAPEVEKINNLIAQYLFIQYGSTLMT